MSSDRFWGKVTLGSDAECWHWSGAIDVKGYGRYALNGRNATAHRVSYELRYGPIADGLVIDHICHNDDAQCMGGVSCYHRRCVNPAHLRAVTFLENVQSGRGGGVHFRAQTHCLNGHEFTPDNLETSRLPHRSCKACKRDRTRLYQRERRRQRAAARTQKENLTCA